MLPALVPVDCFCGVVGCGVVGCGVVGGLACFSQRRMASSNITRASWSPISFGVRMSLDILLVLPALVPVGCFCGVVDCGGVVGCGVVGSLAFSASQRCMANLNIASASWSLVSFGVKLSLDILDVCDQIKKKDNNQF